MSPRNQAKVIYPNGVKEITEDLGTDELVRRLKACAQAFQSMGQDDNNSDYVTLAMHLAQDYFLEHPSKDVRLLIACCIADVFRVYAPEAPYKEQDHLKNIFLFLIKQLRGLEDPQDPAFKRYFYLLENLAWVKSFNICIELEENQEIFCQLFTLFFSIVNDDHSNKVRNFMLDVMAPLLSEADTVSQELLDIVLLNIIEPKKSQNKNAYNLARELLKRTAATVEPYIQNFFNNSLILGKTAESEVSKHLYELIYELNSISPSMLLAVLPQLEFKLKSNDEKERIDVTRLLARMFSDKDSELASHHRALWNCFLGRFNDISLQVRTRCVQYSMHFILNHPELITDITEQLRLRQHDPEEAVRYEVVMAIISAAKNGFHSVTTDLLNFVKERTLDKKFKIRKEALLGLAMIYKKCLNNPDVPEDTKECVSWIKDKVLHVYYQTALDDRLLVERILHTCLVPYQLLPGDRMKKLYQLYSTIDDHAVKALNELLKCQSTVRNHVRGLLELHSKQLSDDRDKLMSQKINVIAKSLPETVKASEFLKKFNGLLLQDSNVRSHMDKLLSVTCSCKEAEESVREVLKKLGSPVMRNVYYTTIKQLLERIAPVMVDREAIQSLFGWVEMVQRGEVDMIEEFGTVLSLERGLFLLHTLSFVFPGAFQFEEVYIKLKEFLESSDEQSAQVSIQIITNVGQTVETSHPVIAGELSPLLQQYSCLGTAKQAKYAVQCLFVISRARVTVFGDILEELKQNLTLDSPSYRTALVSVGHIALRCPELFQAQLKNIVSKTVVKDLLMQDRDCRKDSREEWLDDCDVPEETLAKIEGMKLMVRWLLGLKTSVNSGTSTLRLLTTVIRHDGDLMERGSITRAEMARLRLSAGCCMLKLAQESTYADLLTTEQFHTLAGLLQDTCTQVRERFAQKLHKGLITLRLPLEYMAVFCLGSRESSRDLKTQIKQYLQANINKRRDYMKSNQLSNDKLFLYLPDYVLPFAIHLLAHDKDFRKYDHVKSLQTIKDSLWFLLEPLMVRNENYSFSFFKRLIDNIKQTKDQTCVDDDMANCKLYAVCDLALGLVLSKTNNFVLKEFPVEPALPMKLFTEIDKNYSNTRTYLPAEMAFTPPKKSGIELEMLYNTKGTAAKGGRVISKPDADDNDESSEAGGEPTIKRLRQADGNSREQPGRNGNVIVEPARAASVHRGSGSELLESISNIELPTIEELELMTTGKQVESATSGERRSQRVRGEPIDERTDDLSSTDQGVSRTTRARGDEPTNVDVVKRGRGRPPSNPTSQQSNNPRARVTENLVQQAASDGGSQESSDSQKDLPARRGRPPTASKPLREEEVPKRRGRPPANTSSQESIDSNSEVPARRGRPPSLPKNPENSSEGPAKRGRPVITQESPDPPSRGRPPATVSSQETNDSSADSPPTQQEPTDSPVKRGRPSTASSQERSTDKPIEAPKKRGRPPAGSSSQESTTDEGPKRGRPPASSSSQESTTDDGPKRRGRPPASTTSEVPRKEHPIASTTEPPATKRTKRSTDEQSEESRSNKRAASPAMEERSAKRAQVGEERSSSPSPRHSPRKPKPKSRPDFVEDIFPKRIAAPDKEPATTNPPKQTNVGRPVRRK